ncbi:hypothetical protein EXIGLDRAFT_751913 [Exidia glandulosa HHB12029]|uniref:Uncharacterized protein n=1 Tax=Exidia glandulosa HHB12029 TaxID=1314781 RepID=A0A165EZ83_EXIGL|nr:hypothetical protein EXIGLDRAFT_751913 [Exidia glandulosa HHB12029]
MWCTRWFLPLLLLPAPTAPAYFLLLFIISLTIHARPCVYCIMLLSALFGSSCYWQPLATDYLLARHPSLAPPPEANITLPAYTPMPDRCWCDLYDSVFQPFNTTRWEQRALVRVVRPALEEYKKARKVKEEAEAAAAKEELQQAQKEQEKQKQMECQPEPRHWLLRGDGPLTRFIVDRLVGEPRCKTTPSSIAPDVTVTVTHTHLVTVNAPSPSAAPAPAAAVQPLPWLRRKYDLTPYGVGLILDFGIGPDEGGSTG